MKNIVSISEARSRIFEIAKDAQRPGRHYTFTENGRPKVVLMSAEEYDSLMEDLEILKSPEIMANIKKSQEEYKRGEYVTLQALEKELGYTRLKSPELVLRDKSKKKYKVRKTQKINKIER